MLTGHITRWTEDNMEKNVCIVNFNTTELTRAAILSLWKNTPDAKVTVFDNSDRIPFPEMDNVRIIDNTKGQIIDFVKFLKQFPERQKTCNNFGSAKHSKTIDTLFDYFPDGFVLMDSDVLIKKDISCFFDESVAYSGLPYNHRSNRVLRLLPMLCFINVPMCKKYGIRYFDGRRSWKLNSNESRYMLYDTGASFIEDCRHYVLPYKEIDIREFLIHYKHGSYKYKLLNPFGEKEWLEQNKELYE